MPSHRSLRVAEAIREVVSQAVLFELADPRIKGVTVLRAEVSGDLRNATVFVSVMGTESEQKLALRGIQHATGFLQSKVAARLQTRFTPTLMFKLDDSVKKSIAISKLIDEALASDREHASQAESEAASESELPANERPGEAAESEETGN
jgi:ribosome-binding factor A